jgi:hypothetical protein
VAVPERVAETAAPGAADWVQPYPTAIPRTAVVERDPPAARDAATAESSRRAALRQ